jgi:hypothetical protein
MGYNSTIIQRSSYDYPYATQAKVPLSDRMPIPQALKEMYPNHQYHQECCLQLDEKNSVRRNYFVHMRNGHSTIMAQGLSIWRICSTRSTKHCIHINKFNMSDVSDYYQMRKIQRTDKFQVCSPRVSWITYHF